MNGNFMICTKCSYFSQLFVALAGDMKVSDTCQMCASYGLVPREIDDNPEMIIKSA